MTLQSPLLLLLAVGAFGSISQVSGSEEGNWTIYYDLDDDPVPLLDSELRQNTLRYGYLPCTCQDLTCGCCMNMNINFANFSRSGCMNFTYLPTDFAIEMNVLMNDESIYKRNVSGKNPPPACMEIPINYLPSMQFCVKFFEIYTIGKNLHTCINFETRIERAPILVLEFDCVVMGCDGLSHQKPTESSVTVSGEGGGSNRNASVQELTFTFPEHSLPYLLLPEKYKKNKNSTLYIKTQITHNNDKIPNYPLWYGEINGTEHETNTDVGEDTKQNDSNTRKDALYRKGISDYIC